MAVPARKQPDPAATQSLVRRAQSGDRRAYEDLYRANAARVYALCLRMSGDPAAAEELTQDVFIHAWRRLTAFRHESSFSTWLHTVAVRRVLTDRRTQLRRLARFEPAGDPQGMGRQHTADRLDLERAVAALPPKARAVLILHDIEGHRHAEISALMGVTIGTSKAQLHRARRLLREALNR